MQKRQILDSVIHVQNFQFSPLRPKVSEAFDGKVLDKASRTGDSKETPGDKEDEGPAKDESSSGESKIKKRRRRKRKGEETTGPAPDPSEKILKRKRIGYES